MSSRQWIERRKVGRGFRYYDGTGAITDREQLDYFASLAVPPAWKDVKIAKSKNARILATGVDNARRQQYLYNPAFRAKQEKAKFDRILKFAQALPKMRRTVDKHLKRPKLDREKVLACAVRLMDQAYLRVGNEVYAKENGSYGLTTLRSKHLTIDNETIVLDFTGKSGKKQTKRLTDRTLARIIRRMDELPGYEVFKYYDESGVLRDLKSADVNAYIKEIMGDEFSAKDFRTWAGTLLASTELAAAERSKSEAARKKTVVACVKKVARRLGNTPAIARSSYIDPRIIDAYNKDNMLQRLQNTMEGLNRKSYLKPEEQCLLNVLQTDYK